MENKIVVVRATVSAYGERATWAAYFEVPYHISEAAVKKVAVDSFKNLFVGDRVSCWEATIVDSLPKGWEFNQPQCIGC